MIPINYLKAALLFAARADVRYYLNGIYVTPDAIAATDGCRVIRIMCATGIDTPAIVPSEHIQSAIRSAPKKVTQLQISNARINPVTDGVQLGAAVYSTIEGKYPDIATVLLGISKGYTEGTTELSCNWQYLANCQAAALLVAKWLGRGSQWCTYDLPTSRVLPDVPLREILQMIVLRMHLNTLKSSQRTADTKARADNLED